MKMHGQSVVRGVWILTCLLVCQAQMCPSVSLPKICDLRADAGPDVNVAPGSRVTLYGFSSSSPGGDPLTYHWSQTQGPIVQLENASSPIASFFANEEAVYVFVLTVTTDAGCSDEDTVQISVGSSGACAYPVAQAGLDRQVVPGTAGKLLGSASSDPGGSPLKYYWLQIGGPEVVLSNPFVSEPSFTVPQDSNESLVFELRVTNDCELSATDQVTLMSKKLNVNDCQDTDGDGVTDCDDSCPDTASGAIVDEYGCDISLNDCSAVVSTFDDFDEGWQVQGTNFSVPTQPFHNGDGFITIQGKGSIGWIAPKTFHGNRSCLYGQTLSFQCRGYIEKGDTLVEISGAGLALAYNAPYKIDWEYVGFSIRLDNSEAWYNQQTQQRATASEIQQVLGDLRVLRIWGSVHAYWQNEAVLDNVSLGSTRLGTPAAPIKAQFTNGDEGWRVQGTGFPIPTRPNSDAGDYLTVTRNGTQRWIAPWSSLGNHSAALDTSFSFDTVGYIDLGQGQVVLCGGGHSLYHPAKTKSNWTLLHTDLLLNETQDWRDLETGQRASRQQIQEVLADLTSLVIYGSLQAYWTRDLVLDNVILGY